MRTIVKGKNIEVPERVRDYAERKLHRLERLLDDRTDAIVELSNEMHRSAVGRPHRRGDARHRRADPAQPRGRRQLPGRARRRSSTRSSARPSTTRRSRGSAPGPEQEKRILPPARRRHRGARPASAGSSRRSASRSSRCSRRTRPRRWTSSGTSSSSSSTPRPSGSRSCTARDDGDFGLIEPIVGGDYTTGRSTARAATRRRRTARPRNAEGQPPAGTRRFAVTSPRRPCPAGASRRPGGTARGAG